MTSLNLLTLEDYTVNPYRGVYWDSDDKVGGLGSSLREGGDNDGGDGVGLYRATGGVIGLSRAARDEAVHQKLQEVR